MKLLAALVAGAAAVAMQGCGSSGAGSCQVNGSAGIAGYCISYTGSSYTSSSVQTACANAGGVYSSGSCAAGTNGTCTFQQGTSTEYKWTFNGTDGGTGATHTACTAAGGTFSP